MPPRRKLTVASLPFFALVSIPDTSLLQLICLSATLPNIECLAKWLDASLYRTQYRPVELRHFVCKGRAVYRPSRIGGNGPQQGGDETTLEKVRVGLIIRDREWWQYGGVA